MSDFLLSHPYFIFGMLLSIFPESNRYEFTSKKIFRLKERTLRNCGYEMVHNGYDYTRKKGLGKVRIGKQILVFEIDFILK